jgi:hypothetical protein
VRGGEQADFVPAARRHLAGVDGELALGAVLAALARDAANLAWTKQRSHARGRAVPGSDRRRVLPCMPPPMLLATAGAAVTTTPRFASTLRAVARPARAAGVGAVQPRCELAVYLALLVMLAPG